MASPNAADNKTTAAVTAAATIAILPNKVAIPANVAKFAPAKKPVKADVSPVTAVVTEPIAVANKSNAACSCVFIAINAVIVDISKTKAVVNKAILAAADFASGLILLNPFIKSVNPIVNGIIASANALPN